MIPLRAARFAGLALLMMEAIALRSPSGEAWGQTFPGQLPPGAVVGNPTGVTAPPSVYSFIGSNTGPIPNVSAAQVIMQNSALTKDQIYDPTTAVTVKTFDVVQSVGFLPAGSAIGSVNGFGFYLRNEAVSAGGGVVGNYGLATCGGNNSSCWGSNYRIVDCENVTTCAAIVNAVLIAGEDDFYVGNTCAAGVAGPCISGGNGPTTVGARSVILSSFMDRQPNFAFGWSCSTVSTINGNSPPYWNSCISSLNGAADTAFSVGTRTYVPPCAGGVNPPCPPVPTVPNSASQTIAFTYTDGTGAFQSWRMFVDVGGTLQFQSSQATASMNVGGLAADKQLIVGATGMPLLEVGVSGTDVTFPVLTGAAGFACLDATGKLYKKATACP